MGASFLSLLMTGNGSFGDQKDKTTHSGVEARPALRDRGRAGFAPEAFSNLNDAMTVL